MDHSKSDDMSPYGSSITGGGRPTTTVEDMRQRFTNYLEAPQKVANGVAQGEPITSDVRYDTEMNTPSREEFQARLEAIEARMDARVAKIEGRIDAFIAQAEERDKRVSATMEERDRRMEERDKRIEMLASRSTQAAESASTLKANMWLAALTVVIAVVGTVIAAYFATQSSNIMIEQTAISAFQQGQNTPPAPPKK
ncbi:hypothetical protein DIE17_03770 [Burkholderia sp. Bp9099]|nr:hypothetical protein DIE17_03770 [Burkholderia sp. Bp9099]